MLPLAAEQGSGFIAFSPLAQGLLTNKYLHGIPEHSRAARATGFLKVDQVTEDKVERASAMRWLYAVGRLWLRWHWHGC